MKELPFALVDAFADRPFTGNPAAVVRIDGEWPEDALLQAIAAETNQPETALHRATDDGGIELRWFSPTTEVALCGHATLAAGHILLSADPALTQVDFRTRRSGVLTVARSGDGYELALPALALSPQPLPAIVAALQLAHAPVETLWHPQGYALLVLADADSVRRVMPDFRRLAAEGNILTIITAPGGDTDIVSRAFAPGAGVDEDPATGSAHAVMAPWWAARLGRDRFSAFQASKRGGRMDCRVEGDRAILRGRCVTMIEGVLRT
ncbi:PhzF family phenazine biosynthesis protein [Sphingomonas zeicaulis]|uniref:PhzF family phenazine biosynthesis protein n=1 Tax=Sphingomonas zeicaulis TaxID=1632740 RepID=UPI003D1D18A8